MISSDLDEFIGLADRVLVIHQGRYSGELARQAVTVDRMMISSDLDEFIGLADRVLVIHQGRYSGELARQA
ncbi:hypothetical protein CQA72_29625, partial [Klebsiella pneumoniae]